MPAFRVIPHHPTDGNSKHDDLYHPREDVDTVFTRVDPGEDPAAGDNIRHGISGPYIGDNDGVDPMDHGGTGDGSTDDYAAVMNAITRLGTRGGRLHLKGKGFKCNTPITVPTTIGLVIDGGTRGGNAISGSKGELVFAAGINGIVTQQGSIDAALKLENVGLRSLSAGTGGAGSGIVIRSPSVTLQDYFVQGFGLYGVDVQSHPTVTSANANAITSIGARIYGNGSHGVYLEGSDSNVGYWARTDVTANGGYGIYNSGLYMNTFINAHANGNTLGDYYEDAWSTFWINPYSESNGKFVVSANALHTQVFGGAAGAPSYWYDNAGSIVAYTNQRQAQGVRIWDNGELMGEISLRDEAGTRSWKFRPGFSTAGNMDLWTTTLGTVVTYQGSTGSALFSHGLRPGAKALPAAGVTYRGVILRTEGGAGVADTAWICEKDAADVYSWRAL